MTTLRTARFQNVRAIQASGLLPVRISPDRPRMSVAYEYVDLLALAPSARTFQIRHRRAEFAERYEAQLGRRGPEYYQRRIDRLADRHGVDGLVLLCFEDLRVTGCGS
jgi:hypothetical protein